jgi:PAS domain S-box-containing protein
MMNRFELPDEHSLPTGADELRRRIAALEDRMVLYQQILERIPDAVICLDTDCRVVYVNQIATQELALPAEALLGRTPAEIPVAPEVGALWMTTAQRVLATNRSETFQFRLVHGAVDDVYSTDMVPECAEDGSIRTLVTITRSITDQIRTEAELRSSEAQFRLIFDQSPIGAAITDLDWRFVRVNDALCHMLGYTREELLQLDVAGITHPDDIEYNRARTDAVIAGDIEKFSMEKRCLRKDGRVIWTRTLVRLLREGEHTPYLLGLIEDITEEKQGEEEQRRMERQLQEAQRLESLGVLAGGVAHDFNNILVGILGYAQLALSDLPTSSPAYDNIQHVIGNAQRAANLASQILAYAGKRTVASQTLDLNQLIHDMRSLLQTSVAPSASLNYDLEPDLPPINADATQIRQIVLNLITNAAESILKGVGRIGIATALETLDQAALSRLNFGADQQPGQYVRMSVSDTGCGMDETTRLRMFEPFFTTKFIGRGLGLAAVHGIVRSHRGMVHVTSDPGNGTTINIWFPAIVGQPTPEPPAPTTERGILLVIEREDATRDILCRLLPHLGFDVVSAADQQAGLQILADQTTRLSGVILDPVAPLLPNSPFLLTFRAQRPDLPIILIAGPYGEAIPQHFGGIRIAGILQKPFTLSEVRDAIKQLQRLIPTGRQSYTMAIRSWHPE